MEAIKRSNNHSSRLGGHTLRDLTPNPTKVYSVVKRHELPNLNQKVEIRSKTRLRVPTRMTEMRNHPLLPEDFRATSVRLPSPIQRPSQQSKSPMRMTSTNFVYTD